jgi:hypothetical protein
MLRGVEQLFRNAKLLAAVLSTQADSAITGNYQALQ